MSPHTIKLRPDGCIMISIVGDSDRNLAQEFATRLKSIFEHDVARSFTGLVDLSNAGTSSVEAQKIFADVLSHPQVGKVAFVAAGEIAKLFTEFVIKFSRKKDVRFFDSSIEAELWLSS